MTATSDWGARRQALSDEGLDALCQEEGLRLDAYQDDGGVWTIGYGHTGPDVHAGTAPVTAARARELLRQDVAAAEAAVRSGVRGALHQHEFDALVSLVFNIGGGAFGRSTLLAKLNRGDFHGAAAEFTRWARVAGKLHPGLVARRTRELLRFAGLTPGRQDAT